MLLGVALCGHALAAAVAPADGDARRLAARPRATAPAPVPPSEPTTLEAVALGIGEIRMLPVNGTVKRIAMGSGSFASATTVDGRVMLIGEAAGRTSMMVWTDREITAYQLTVRPADDEASRGMLEKIVAEPGSKLVLSDFETKLVVSGAASKQTLDNLNGLTRLIPRLVVNVRPDPETVRSVLFRLHFVEVNKSLLESLGIQWNKDAPGLVIGAQKIISKTGIYQTVPPAQGNTNLLDPERPFVSVNGKTGGVFLGLATTIASRLKFGASDGDARLLASPELTAMSGGKARLQVGGEVPIPLAGAFGTQTVEFKPYGIIFNIEPTIGENGSITAKVSTELSQIDPAVTVAGIPGFLTRNTATEINVRPGEMVALSGLVNAELSTAIDKVPGLGNIPVLGRLFRSDDFRSKRTDLVVLLEPEIVTPGEGMAEALRQRGTDAAQEFEDKVRQATKPAEPPKPVPTAADPALR